jgi:hypothetical protein
MRRALLVAVLAALMVLASAGAAFAGEWNPGHFNDTGGDLPAKFNANSECLFNGLDETDETSLGAGDGEPFFDPGDGTLIGDDGIWASAPSGGIVQSAGQAILAGIAPPGAPGEACNGHLNPQK